MSPTLLSSRERLLAAIKKESPDYVPLSLHIQNGPLFQKELFWRDQFDKAKKLLDMGLDPFIEIWMPDVQPHPDVEIKTWREKKGDDILLTKEYHTPAGVLSQTVRETEDWPDWDHGYWIPTTFGIEKRDGYGMRLFDDHNISRRLEPWLKTPEDLEKLKYVICLPEGYLLDEWKMNTERAMAFAKEHNLLTIYRRPIVGDAYQWFCDIPWFMMQIFENPQFVKDFFGLFQNWALQLIDLGLEAGVDVVQYRGWYETPPFWGPQTWEEFLMPNIREQADKVHSAGKLFSYLLPEGQGLFADVLPKAGIDILQGVDAKKLHGGDLKTLGEKLSDKMALWGGINAEVTINSGDAQVIDKAVKETIEALSQNGGHVLSSIIGPFHSHDGIMLMIDSWKKYRNI